MIKSKSCTFFGNVYNPIGSETRSQESLGHQEDGSTPDKAGVIIISLHGKLLGQYIDMVTLTANLRLLLRKDV